MIKNISDYVYRNLLNNERFLFLFTILAVELYLFPLYFFGQGTQVQIFDNLDIVFPVLKTLTSSGLIFAPSDTIVPNMMGGLPRLVYGTEFNVYVWLFYYFPPFTAFAINETIIHLGAFFSMFVLLNRYFVPTHNRYRRLIIHSVSLMFALLPFYTGAGLSVPSIPLALYAFLNIRSGSWRWYDWTIIVLIPFYSSLILVYFFFLLLMGSLLVIDLIRERKFNSSFLLALIVMSLVFLMVEYRLFYDTFVEHLFVSHRKEFSALQNNTLFETYRAAHQIFLNGTTDMDTLASVSIIPFMLLVILATFLKKRLSWQFSLLFIAVFFTLLFFPLTIQVVTGNKFAMPILMILSIALFIFKKQYRLFYGAILVQLLCAYWYGLWFYEGTGALAHFIPILREFNFARIALLQPVIWFIIVALGMVIIARKFNFAPLLIIGIVLMQAYTTLNIREFSAPNSPFTYKAYFAEDLFTKIKHSIKSDPSTYRVGCIGFEPSIAVFNGLYTIDGYVTSYPLEYKHRFYKIIKKTLSTDDGNRKIFLGWGSKCYLFDGGESSLNFRSHATVKKLSLDMKAYSAIGGKYLISAHKIEESQLKNLIFMQEFRDKNTFWTMYLYRVDLTKE
ncbi:MAG: DUF6044 family protein [Sulfuricurvum sp.]|nr:DUF6044 family protein [Sulfuricurvum sp.]